MGTPGVRYEDWRQRVSEDHVLPTARGGSNDIRNKVAMHAGCNNDKGDRLPNGCEIIWRHVTNKGLDLYYEDLVEATTDPPARFRRGTLADVWPADRRPSPRALAS